MARLTVGTENNVDIEIYYEDHGTGQPVVLIHGYPLNGRSWERQERALLEAGYRVITYDRRGFGLSSQPTAGYDYDTFAADLNTLLEHLALDDVVLVGFSMGTGEVTRYLGTYGSARVRKAALLGAIPPFLLQDRRQPRRRRRRGLRRASRRRSSPTATPTSRTSSTTSTTSTVLGGTRISDQAWQASFNVAAGASPHATYACVDTWLTDFRADLPRIDVPVLVVHGTEDRILPIERHRHAAARAGRRPQARPGRGRAAQHRLDPPRRGQQGRCSTSSPTDGPRPQREGRRRHRRKQRQRARHRPNARRTRRKRGRQRGQPRMDSRICGRKPMTTETSSRSTPEEDLRVFIARCHEALTHQSQGEIAAHRDAADDSPPPRCQSRR